MFLKIRKLPNNMSCKQPSVLFATWFGSGLIKPASGTWGSLAAIPPGIAIAWFGGGKLLCICAIILYFIGVGVANSFEKKSGEKDASAIVIDEVVGLWIAALPALTDPILWVCAFILFRIFDIWKPWPVSAFDKMSGGHGVMMDDVVAGLYALPGVMTIALFTSQVL